jgi:hypothetical protein
MPAKDVRQRAVAKARRGCPRGHLRRPSGFRDNPLYHSGIALLEPLIHRGDEALQDVLEWITAEEKKKRPGTMS